jgi:AraC-like DNA-binding protein
MDALSEVLKAAHLTGGVFLHAEFSAPWCVAAKIAPEYCMPALGAAPHVIPYHYVAEGHFQLRIETDGGATAPVTLGPGEVVLLPRNDAHLMGSDLALRPVLGHEIIHLPAAGHLRLMRHGGDGPRARLVCGFLGSASPDSNPVLTSLPPLLKLTLKEGATADWIHSTLRFAAEEVAAGRPGSSTVLEKVSELLFVEAVRRHAEGLSEGEGGWLAGLRDPYVARALALMHGEVARAWSVDDLGREVGLSRSALADRFVRLIGVPPAHYLARWRMQVAMQKLRGTASSLAQVAEMVGYESEAAFSRAFKKVVGTAPGTWRRGGAAQEP